MSKFKVGDRVAYYNPIGRHTLTVMGVDEERLCLQEASGSIQYAHPKQCRRIKPKAKLREIWVRDDRVMTSCEEPRKGTGEREWTHYREVRKRK